METLSLIEVIKIFLLCLPVIVIMSTVIAVMDTKREKEERETLIRQLNKNAAAQNECIKKMLIRHNVK